MNPFSCTTYFILCRFQCSRRHDGPILVMDMRFADLMIIVRWARATFQYRADWYLLFTRIRYKPLTRRIQHKAIGCMPSSSFPVLSFFPLPILTFMVVVK